MKKYIIILFSMLLLAGNLTNAQTIKRSKQKTEQTSKPKAKQVQKKQKSNAGSTGQPSKSQNKKKQDNEATQLSTRGGVKTGPTLYNHPIINMKEIKDKLENDHYLVFLDTKGTVVGFIKSSRKYFTIYSGRDGTATVIRLTGDNCVLIKTDGGSIIYDLVQHRYNTLKPTDN